MCPVKATVLPRAWLYIAPKEREFFFSGDDSWASSLSGECFHAWSWRDYGVPASAHGALEIGAYDDRGDDIFFDFTGRTAYSVPTVENFR